MKNYITLKNINTVRKRYQKEGHEIKYGCIHVKMRKGKKMHQMKEKSWISREIEQELEVILTMDGVNRNDIGTTKNHPNVKMRFYYLICPMLYYIWCYVEYEMG
eukprot:223905_1